MEQMKSEEVGPPNMDQMNEPEAEGPSGATPGDMLRALPAEAQTRGSRFVSAQAMQARLFSVYDAAAAAEDALALVQQQLTLTLNRGYYDADEIESMADQLDSLLALDSLELSVDELSVDELAAVDELAGQQDLVSEEE